MDVVAQAEAELRHLSGALTEVREGECLACYLDWMISQFNCAGDHRFTARWRDAQPRPMPGLLAWVKRNGGCCCDCEVAMNVFYRGRRSQRHRRFQCEAHYRRSVAEQAAW